MPPYAGVATPVAFRRVEGYGNDVITKIPETLLSAEERPNIVHRAAVWFGPGGGDLPVPSSSAFRLLVRDVRLSEGR
jgi:hypothetical protein